MAQQPQQSNAMLIVTVLIVAVVAFAGGYLVGQQNDKLGQQPLAATGASRTAPTFGNAAPANSGAKSTLTDSSILPVTGSAILGNPDAPITIVEFSDFQCPYCQRGGNTIKQLQRKYPNDIRIVFKHYPLPFHKEAPDASVAAMAAGQQGKFWEMHDKLFDNFRKFKGQNMKELTAGYAQELGLDVNKYKTDFDNPQFRANIKRDMGQGTKVGVRGTPHFFVNGHRISGAQPIGNFESVVKKQLDEIRKMTASGTNKKDIYQVMVKKNYKAAAPPKPRAPKAQAVNFVPVNKNDAMKGNTKNPLITIVEFSDFQCPYCNRGNSTIQQVMKKYGADARLIFKHLPLPFHKEAKPFSRATLAAKRQGKFWEMHDKGFANFRKFKGQDMDALVAGYAEELGLNMAKFKKDYNDPAIAKQVEDDIKLASSVGARGTPNFFINGVQLVGAQPMPAFEATIKKQMEIAKKIQAQKKLNGDALYKEIVAYNKANAPKAAPKPNRPSPVVDMKLLSVDGSPVLGPKNAPITIYEFSDFQCPYCQRGANTIKQVLAKYPKRVKVVFKHNPLPFHKQAPAAHRASYAAMKQGKFLAMHDKLFANFRVFKGQDMDALVAGYAEELGLNVAKFKADYNSPEAKAQIKRDMAMGAKAGVRGTPNFIVQGTRVVGAQPLPAFEKAIEEALKKMKK